MRANIRGFAEIVDARDQIAGIYEDPVRYAIVCVATVVVGA
jgi:hypothetical protein